MIRMENDGGVFTLRVAGILVRDGKALICREINDNFYVFPGGSVRTSEDTAGAITREFREQMGADTSTVRLLWVNESFFTYECVCFHEMCFYYLVELDSSSQLPEADTFYGGRDELGMTRFEYKWVEIDKIDNETLVPEYIKYRLGDLPSRIEHMIIRK